jgi:hypothetical protein|uniref:Uncharacterized protein ycf89 n=1 Tax=Trieres chinensis TaxID=1514140 RepID=YCF89_TRICV|nr:hypothetical protein OdsiCp001 [Trieres chinensis]NP_043635.1 ORF355 [Trieres chinensis]YP_010537345.1 hypothetical protein ON826_pgp116 [Odontella regia]YP_010537400.1 hypothetical protein ON826_pgp061 [Odontella regia]P49827.1 RecName: Full=Uncharacterized protein ycf89; AltName: Full=ORF355 [Trieres chinensis]UYC31132.1 hypothetical protein [Odontella regia]UYC31187.1 hypothetical protein [Odontella regia]CAA91611.1 ORF355 [Trieres chinensis]CAA91667.1 ORF355 [Trieres chinensis]
MGMSLQLLGINLRIKVILATSWLFENIAKVCGYPTKTLGMPIRTDVIPGYGLPIHQTRVPPFANPTTFLEAVFGNIPQPSTIEKFYYESPQDGYYNFYIPHYRNVVFLPDWLSKWIQLHFDLGIDTVGLETIRNTLFSMLVYFYFFAELRIMLSYFISINPYTRPWVYLISLTDWIYDILFHLGISKRVVLLGFPLLPILIHAALGNLIDSLNHLVFTMPFLPSEGEPGEFLIDGTARKVLLFRYLPALWTSEPIPDRLREFWYTERPEIYQFMKKNYGHLDIDFLPDEILKQIYQFKHDQIDPNSLTKNVEQFKVLGAQLISDSTIDFYQFSNCFVHKQEILFTFFSDYMDRLI